MSPSGLLPPKNRLTAGRVLQAGFGQGVTCRNGQGDNMRGGLLGRQSPMGLGRGRSEEWQRGGFARGGGRGGPVGYGLVGGGIGPLSLITGAKKLLQDVSEVELLQQGSRMMLNLSQDVLYLMIVQRPTEDQMAEAMERMSSAI